MPSDAARLPLGDIVRYAELANGGFGIRGVSRRSPNLSRCGSLSRSRVGGFATVAYRVQAAASGDRLAKHRGLRKCLRHEYESVDPRLVWLTVRDHLPALKAVAEAELRRLDAAGG